MEFSDQDKVNIEQAFRVIALEENIGIGNPDALPTNNRFGSDANFAHRFIGNLIAQDREALREFISQLPEDITDFAAGYVDTSESEDN